MLILAENVSTAMTGKKLVAKKEQFSPLMELMLMVQSQRVDILPTSLSMNRKCFCNFGLGSSTFFLLCCTSRNFEMKYT